SGHFYDEIKDIRIYNSETLDVSDSQSVNFAMLECIAKEGSEKELGQTLMGGRRPFGYYSDNDYAKVRLSAQQAAKQAIVNLKAVAAPAGLFPVVVGPGWGGLLVHESVGHCLEADAVVNGTSVFGAELGVKIGSNLVTLLDDGTVARSRGSFNFDDEGNPAKKTVLIDRGVMTGFMTDRLSGKALGLEVSGNARRQSYRYVPLPRMSNTYIAAGESDPQEIISSVKKGVYAKNFSGGMVEHTTGNFTFTITEGYLIQNGKLSAPIKKATLMGNGTRILAKVEMVGNDLRIDKKSGHCGKDGQTVYVGLGQPTIKISEMTVGGTGN
ncbi:TldD/PmbA family protein, partial [Candidatus Riflebacteria bacterium]